MSNWSEKLKNHPLHATLTQLLDWVQIEVDKITDDISEVRRFEKVIRRVQANLQSIDAEFVAFAELDVFNNALKHQNIWNQVSAFGTNGNAAHIRNANAHLTNALNGKQWLVVPSIVGEEVAQENLREVYDDLAHKFQVLKEKFGNLDKEKAVLETTIENRRQEVDQQISQWQKQFSEAQEKRSENYQDWKSNLEKSVSESNNELIDKTASKLEKLESDTNMFLSGLSEQSEKKHNRIQELYELASGDSISGGYAQTAKEESNHANFWRGISIIFIGLTVGWLLVAFFFYSSGGFHTASIQLTSSTEIASENTGVIMATLDWSRYLLTFSITAVLLFGAGYTGKQSTRHRDESRRTLHFALQVKALDPYISSLPEEEQIIIKKALIEKFFDGVGERSSSDGEVHISESMVNKFLQDLIDKVIRK